MAAERTEQRKLAAIMFTDMVGYSAVTQKNEALALKLLDEHRELLRPLFPKYSGQEVKTIGDAFLIEFSSALDAVRCAIEMQKVLTEYNASSPETIQIQIRIGIHVGDVIHRENDVYGDGVNIASRIEPLAEPGGICLTQQVYDQVHNKLDMQFVSLGAGELKNIHVPVNIFRLVLPWEKPGWSFWNQLRRRLTQKKIRAPVVAALVLLILSFVAWQMYFSDPSDAQECFRRARAIAGHSSSHLEGRRNNPKVIRLLEQAVRIDPDFAEAHADLALAYVIRLFLYAPAEKELEEKAYLEVDRALSLKSNLPTAYLARGRLKWTPLHKFPHEDAINDFRKALELDPMLDEAHHYLGLVFLHIGLLAEGRREFEEACRINSSNNAAQFRLGETLFYEGKFQQALNILETIHADFNPDLKEYQVTWAMFSVGKTNEATARLERYLSEHPADQGGLLASVQAMMAAARGNKAEAEKHIDKAGIRRDFGHFHHVEYNIACAYALLNEPGPAIMWLSKAVTEGFNCYPLFRDDPNLYKIRGDPNFRNLLADEAKRYEYFKAKFGGETAYSGQRP